MREYSMNDYAYLIRSLRQRASRDGVLCPQDGLLDAHIKCVVKEVFSPEECPNEESILDAAVIRLKTFGKWEPAPLLEHMFTYHPPKEGAPEIFKELRNKAKELAYLIANTAPDCEDTKESLNRLREAVMWANSAISRHGVKSSDFIK